MHIAAAVGTQVLGLFFSSAYFTETAPYGTHNIVIQTELSCPPCHEKDLCEKIQCKDYITVPAVKYVVDALLERRNDLEDFNFPHLSLYQSRFLSNGMLIYVPVCTSGISGHYLTGFFNRIMWESALGIEHDKAFLNEFIPKMRILKTLNKPMEKQKNDLCFLHSLYLKGTHSAEQIVSACASSSPNQEIILSFFNELQAIECDISKPDFYPGIIKDFHSLEMLDLRYDHCSALAGQLARKYRKLKDITDIFLKNLACLFT